VPTPKELNEKAEADRLKARLWLARFIQPGLPKVFTKEELWQAASGELQVSRSAFDFAWIWVIEENGCQHWYEPLPRNRRHKPS
jgi:hypothetical protein